MPGPGLRLWSRPGRRLLLLAVLGLATLAACRQPAEPATVTFPPAPTLAGYPAPIETGSAVALESLEEPAYPAPEVTPAAPDTSVPEGTAYPPPGPAAMPAPPTPGLDPALAANRQHLPLAVVPILPSPTSTPKPTKTPLPTPTPTPTIDFAAVRAQLQTENQDLSFVKLGFHIGVGGSRVGLGDWMRTLDAAGVPFFLKSADDTGPLVEAQNIIRSSGVPHTLVYRRSGNEFDTPNYDLEPEAAARQHWQLHMNVLPPELDRGLVWVETINEVDKNRAEWLGRFALETARLAETDGIRWAAFGWSSGEPEVTDWQEPSMVAFLKLAAANPDRLAIALHEYSYTRENIADLYPFKVGRFQQFYQLTDELGIPRPTVLITEWGWEYQRIPSIDRALQDIAWAASMYAPYPEVKGAAIWYLGNGFADIAKEVQPLIRPLTEYNLGNYFVVPLPPEQAPIDPERYRP